VVEYGPRSPADLLAFLRGHLELGGCSFPAAPLGVTYLSTGVHLYM
jgi:hypothetical protein